MSNFMNEHDMTKMMINVMSRKILKEEIAPSDDNKMNDTINFDENSQEYKDEFKKIFDMVDSNIQITSFKLYPKDNNAELEGRMNAGVNFYMSKKEDKLSISITDDKGNATKIYLDNELFQKIQKLLGYYENWKKEWSGKLANEYKSK